METSDSFYTKFARSYSRYAESQKAYLRSVDSFVAQNLPHGLRVVDIGSGTGSRARTIAAACKAESLALVDNSDGMVSIAQDAGGAIVLKADISSTAPVSDRRYQASLCLWNVIGHIPSKEGRLAALRNIYSLLEPGGILFLDVNNRYNVAHYGISSVAKNALKDLLRRDDRGDFRLDMEIEGSPVSTTVHIFSPLEVRRLIKKAGFKIVKTEHIDYRTGERGRNALAGQLAFMLIRP